MPPFFISPLSVLDFLCFTNICVKYLFFFFSLDIKHTLYAIVIAIKSKYARTRGRFHRFLRFTHLPLCNCCRKKKNLIKRILCDLHYHNLGLLAL